MKWFDFWLTSSASVVSWRELTIFAVYRLFLATMLFVVFYLKLPPDFLGHTDPDLYLNLSVLYVFVAVIWLILSLNRWGEYGTLTRMQLLSDIVLIISLIHTSGGLQTGLGTLLIVVVIAGGALIPGRISAFIAAIAALSVLLEASYSQITGDGVTKYSHAGMLGATFFVTALLAQMLSQKMKLSQMLVEQHAQNAAKSAALNEHIISSMQTGVLVIDDTGVVKLSNNSARSLLGVDKALTGVMLVQAVPMLAKQLFAWKNQAISAFKTVQIRPDLPEISIRATKLNNGEILIYIDNASALAQQVQQMKLASLGRLTASIAHEIRNPLGAISHASELLAEVNHNETSIKLTGIIQRHSERVNGIIETILEMSRRKIVEQTQVLLATWLEKFLSEFCEIKHIDTQDIKLTISVPLARVNIDAEQLHQVMWNLLENAWHYSVPNSLNEPRVEVQLYNQNNEIRIDVSDTGDGVSESMQQHLFEPFHSDRQGGTGLGLYLARELCQANGARLNYLPDVEKPCFRISFPLERSENLQ